VSNARTEPASTRPACLCACVLVCESGRLAALIASAGLTRTSYVGNYQDGAETHDFPKLLLARCVAVTPGATIHTDGKEMAGKMVGGGLE
jgi:hypothetical protein